MKLFRILDGERIPLSLRGERVQDHRLVQLTAASEIFDDLAYVVTVDRSEIENAEFLERKIGRKKLFDAVFEPLHAPAQVLAEAAGFQDAVEPALERVVCAVCAHHRQRIVDAAHVLSDRHLVVVQNDKQRDSLAPRVVERLKGKSAGHGAVADQRDRHSVLSVVLHGARKTERRGDRGACVSGVERVVFAFGILRKTGNAVLLAKRIEDVLASGQDLVHICLMPHVEHQLVRRTVEHIVHRNDQFDRAETGGEMPARLGDVLDQKCAQLFAKRRKLFFLQRLEVLYAVDGIQDPITHITPFDSVMPVSILSVCLPIPRRTAQGSPLHAALHRR